ncbi:GNAT family N-acetyltransferase [Dictyobacter arantiisoli]|uniref:N-acetyltransferase n=1 Tax=Dictyobacter arantiisoli TaxID=2014874 RepID=A0A5A5TDY4_9CHLR|nr:GNAT family protein [Dictyobacter arantiisoli]GCF09435.1 N-acetyltransferase [Dictyobacter arantiisoli]
MMITEPCTLTGQLVRLEPLQPGHAEELYATGRELETWKYIPTNPCLSLETMQQWIADTLQLQQKGEILPFAIIDLASGRVVGSTRYLAIMPSFYNLEIGWTWLDPSVRRSGINTECKYLLLQHAFEDWHAIRVQLKTDSRNLRSQAAIARIGGVKEGVLRNHMIMPDGYRRHSVYFSILDSEWEQVKANLIVKMHVYEA